MRRIVSRGLSTWRVVVCVFAGVSAYSGANAQLRIEITRGVDRPLPMAIVPFGWEGPGGEAPFDLTGLISTDLRQSGRFDPLEDRDMISRPTQPADVDFDDWRILEVDVLVIGSVAESGPGQYEIVFQLF
ncbi:MAG: Tol-Pal system protein TolB, partial [Gammaproteobacteria bacterium]